MVSAGLKRRARWGSSDDGRVPQPLRRLLQQLAPVPAPILRHPSLLRPLSCPSEGVSEGSRRLRRSPRPSPPRLALLYPLPQAIHRPAASMSKLISYLPPPLPLLIDVLKLRNPVNGVLFALATILTLRILLPPPPYVPAPYGLPTDPSEAYNWRPQKHPHTQLSRTWTPQELQKYDGKDPNHEDGRILFAIRRKVYDVTAGRSFYGPGGLPEDSTHFLHPGRADTGGCP